MRSPSRSTGRRSVVFAHLALGACLSLAGCIVTAEQGRRMQADIDRLRQDLADARAQLQDTDKRMEERQQAADAKIHEVTLRLSDIQRAAHMTDADFGVQVERLIRELQELRGAAELNQYRLNKLEQALSKQETTPERRGDAPDKGGMPASTAVGPAPISELPKDKTGLLAHAKTLVEGGKVDEARKVLRDILTRWPNEAGTTDEAQFQLGETYYNEQQYQAAIQEYVQIVEKFRAGKVADDAYYRIGLCSMKLENYEDAQIFFQEIVNNHKGSPLYKHAQGKLAEAQKALAAKKKKPEPPKKK